MVDDIYTAFLKARNLSERLLRAHSAEPGSFARKYHLERALDEFGELTAELYVKPDQEKADA